MERRKKTDSKILQTDERMVITRKHMNLEELAWYREHAKVEPTGELLTLTYPSGYAVTYVVFEGNPPTAYEYARDCGDHYIIAKWFYFMSVDKETLEITKGVEDV